MAMEIANNYSSYAAQGNVAGSIAGSGAADSTKKKETEQTAGNSRTKNTTTYMSELAKLAPSVDFRVGNTYSSAKKGQTLTINPKLLEKMQTDPEKEKEMKELIKGVESMTKLSEGINNASGWKTVFRHSYIDENGKYCHIALIRNEHGYKMSEKLREERRKNSEKWLEKSKEKAAQKKEERQEELEEKRAEKGDEKTVKAEEIIKEKIDASKDGVIYMDNSEFKTIMDAIKKENAVVKQEGQVNPVGTNMDVKI